VAGVKLPVARLIQPGRSVIKPAATVTRRIRRRGEHGISRKAIAQGMPECSDCTCMLVCAFPCASCTRDRGCSVHPAFPAPSSLVGETPCTPRTQCAARTRIHAQLSSSILCAIARWSGRSSISETSMIESIGHSVPAFAGKTTCLARRTPPYADPLLHIDADDDNDVSFSSLAGTACRRIAVEIPT